MAKEADRTLHAQMAFDLSDVFAFKFDPVRFGTRRPRRLELSKPDGPSTAGGRVARQNMVLVPVDESSATSPIVVGWVDAANKRAELRSFRMLGKQFEARHGRGIDLEADAYDQLDTELSSFFNLQKIDLNRVDGPVGGGPSPDGVVERGPRESSTPMVGMLFLGIALGLGLGYLIFGT